MTGIRNTTDPQKNHFPINDLGAVILCGGQSSRMGFPKHELWYDGQTFLQAVLASVRQVAKAVVVVSAFGEEPPASLPDGVKFICDEQPDLGPLEGIRVGLRVLEAEVPYAFVTSCDVPRLQPKLIRYLVEVRGDFDAVVPIQGERVYGMTAIYRTSLHERISEIYALGESRRVSLLSTVVNSRTTTIEELRDVDPELDSFTNVNSVDEYFFLMKRSGLKCPTQLSQRLQVS